MREGGREKERAWFLAWLQWINPKQQGGMSPSVLHLISTLDTPGDFPDLSRLLNQHCCDVFLFYLPSLCLTLILLSFPSSPIPPTPPPPSLASLISRHFYWSAGFGAEIPFSVYQTDLGLKSLSLAGGLKEWGGGRRHLLTTSQKRADFAVSILIPILPITPSLRLKYLMWSGPARY